MTACVQNRGDKNSSNKFTHKPRRGVHVPNQILFFYIADFAAYLSDTHTAARRGDVSPEIVGKANGGFLSRTTHSGESASPTLPRGPDD